MVSEINMVSFSMFIKPYWILFICECLFIKFTMLLLYCSCIEKVINNSGFGSFWLPVTNNVPQTSSGLQPNQEVGINIAFASFYWKVEGAEVQVYTLCLSSFIWFG